MQSPRSAPRRVPRSAGSSSWHCPHARGHVLFPTETPGQHSVNARGRAYKYGAAPDDLFSAPLTRRSGTPTPADLAAATPAARAGMLVALDLNDIVHRGSSTDNLDLTWQERIGPGHRGKQERTG